MEEINIPGLHKAPKPVDLEASQQIYNKLPQDSKQPAVDEKVLVGLAKLYVRHGVEGVFGVHLVHSHHPLPKDHILLGADYNDPPCRWARPSKIAALDLEDIHGHIFALTEEGFCAYEYQTGPIPDLSGVDSSFFRELAEYLKTEGLNMLLGLQILGHYLPNMVELVLHKGTVMLRTEDVIGCTSSIPTGWKFKNQNGQPQVCQANETHGQTRTGHEVVNKGDPYPRLDTFDDLKLALKDAGLLAK